MPKFNFENYLQYAFGPKRSKLTDEQFERGMRLIASHYIASEVVKGNDQVYGSALIYMKNPENVLFIKDYLLNNYNITGLKEDADFMTDPLNFYDKEKVTRQMFVSNIENETRVESVAKFTVALDMMGYYYKSGASIRSTDNKEAHQFDALYSNIGGLNLPGDQTALLQRKKDAYEREYPSKDQMKEAFKSYILCYNDQGLSNNTFANMSIDDKRAAINDYTPEEICSHYRKLFFDTFNRKPLTARENALINRSRANGLPVDETAYRYERNLALKKMYGDNLDKENVKNSIKLIKTLKELHASRPRWQRFFFYFGEVGKENDLIDKMVKDLVTRGVDKKNLIDAINGNEEKEQAIVDGALTPERRKELENMERKVQVKRELGIQSAEQLQTEYLNDENRLVKRYIDENDISRTLLVNEEDQKLLVEDIKIEENIEEYDLEDEDIMEQDFRHLKYFDPDKNRELNKEELEFDPRKDKGNLYDDELTVFDTAHRDVRIEVKEAEEDEDEWEEFQEDEKEVVAIEESIEKK